MSEWLNSLELQDEGLYLLQKQKSKIEIIMLTVPMFTS